VESIAPKATIVSGVVNYEVTIDIPKDAQLLKPDMTANVSVRTAQHKALLLPATTVQRDGEPELRLYHLAGNGPQPQTGGVGAKEAGMLEIKRGISQSDEVLLLPPGGIVTNPPTKSAQ